MRRRVRIASSPWLTLALAAALAVSLAFHAIDDGSESTAAPRIVAFEASGPDLRPDLLVDFDAPMTGPEGIGEPLDLDHVTLDPPIAVEAVFVTPRRLRVRPTVGLPPFTVFRLILGDALADVEGRAVDRAAGPALTFRSSVFGLAEPPATRVGSAKDDVVCELAFNGPVRSSELDQHLRLETASGREIPFRLRGGGCDWTLRPERLEGETAVLVIGAGLSRAYGGGEAEAERRYGLTWPTELRITDVRLRRRDRSRRIELRFSHHLAEQDVLPFVSIQPTVADLSAELRGARLVLHGRFASGRTLDVRVRKGLQAVQGLSLSDDVIRFVKIPPLEPDVRIAPRGRTLSTAARPELEIEGVNVPAVDVTIHEVHPSNVVPLALRWRRAEALAREPRTKRIAVEATLDERWTRRLDLAAILGAAPRGIYHVEVEDPQTRWTRDTRLLQVTDLAPLVRVRPDRLLVLVTRLSDGSPVPGARVEAYDAKNQRVASGTTDERGLLVVAGSKPRVVTVSTSDDRAYVDLLTHGLAHDAREIEGRAPAQGLEAFVYADRGVVRPGETCRVGAVVRTPGGRAPAERLPLELRLHAPDGRIAKTWTRRTNVHGMLTLDAPFLPDAPTGPYRIDLVAEGRERALGSVAFRVASIVPDRIEPALRLPAGDLHFGASVQLEAAASLLTGRPAPGLQARLRVRYAPEPAVENDGFVFGDADAAPKPFRLDLADVRLDAEGVARIETDLPASNPSGLPLHAVFELEVVDVSGRAAFVRETRRVMPKGARLGLALPADDGFAMSVVAEGVEAVEGTAVLERLRWEGSYIYERRRGRPVWRSELLAHPVQERPFEIVGGRGVVAFDEVGDGRYRVRIRADGVSGAAIRFERWGNEIQRSADDGGAPRLDLQLVDEAVVPGGTAAIRADVPFAGRGLLTVEGPGSLEARIVTLRAGLQSFEVDVPDAPAPNVYATLTAWRGVRDAADGSARVLGAVRLPLARPERLLDVVLDAPDRAVPGTELVLGLSTSQPASVRVHLVDEGVLRLTGHRSPDPTAYFESPTRLDTRLADAWSAVLERMRFGGDDPEPGGGEGVLAERLDPTARKTIETVALASTLVSCDGQTTVSFVLPEQYEGRLRVFAVAAGEASTGMASTDLVLEAPISVAVHVPRAVAPGDVFEVPIQVRGEGVEYDVTLDGLERIPEADGLVVRAGERMGVASVVVHATDTAGNETLRRALLSVRPPASYVVRHEVRRVAAGEIEMDLPGTWLAGHRRARLTVGASGLLALLPALDRLLEYPYGCVEQTISRAFPLLALAELARLGNPEGDVPRDTVAACIDRLLSMQTSDGGLGMWPGDGTSYPYGSAYAAHFLLAAQGFDRPVPERQLGALLDYLEARLRRGDVDAYTARVLALGGRAVGPFLERLAEEAQRAEDVANLAAAFLHTGDVARADAMLAKAGDPWAAPTRRGGRLDSPVRAAATLLAALVDARPDDVRIPELVERLTTAVHTGGGHTTQTDAGALLALAKVHASNEARTVRGSVRAGGRELDLDGSGGVIATVDADDPWRVGVSADGPVTLVVRTEGIPLDTPKGATEHGIRVERRIVAPPGPLRQGRVYEVVIEGHVPADCENLLVTDVLPGGLEIEAARDREGTLEPDRVEPRDDRVLFFRTKPLEGEFRQTYLVRAVTVGTFRMPSVRAELLYAPAVYGRGSGDETLEVVR